MPAGRTDAMYWESSLRRQEEILDEDIEKLIEERQAARKAKDFAKADADP